MLFKKIILAKIGLGNYLEFDSLTNINGNFATGDELIVRGEHDLGTEQIVVDKDITIEFKGYPKITSSNTNGTILIKSGITLVLQGQRQLVNTSGDTVVLEDATATLIDGDKSIAQQKEDMGLKLYLGEKTDAEIQALDTSTLVKGNRVYNLDIPSEQSWNGTDWI